MTATAKMWTQRASKIASGVKSFFTSPVMTVVILIAIMIGGIYGIIALAKFQSGRKPAHEVTQAFYNKSDSLVATPDDIKMILRLNQNEGFHKCFKADVKKFYDDALSIPTMKDLRKVWAECGTTHQEIEKQQQQKADWEKINKLLE